MHIKKVQFIEGGGAELQEVTKMKDYSYSFYVCKLGLAVRKKPSKYLENAK